MRIKYVGSDFSLSHFFLTHQPFHRSLQWKSILFLIFHFIHQLHGQGSNSNGNSKEFFRSSLYEWNNLTSTFVYTSAQPYLVQCNDALSYPAKPQTLPDLQLLVRDALRRKHTLKPLGKLHSNTDLICTNGVPVEMSKINHFSYSERSTKVTVGAGATLHSLVKQLHSKGRTIYGLPSYSDVTVGGALGTGTHGTGLYHHATLSDQMVALTVIDGRGDIRKISDRHTLRAFKANLGLLGIVYEVTFATVPQFKIQIKNYEVSEKVLWNGQIFEPLSSKDWFQFWWFPSAKKVILSEGNPAPMNTTDNCKTQFISEVPLENAKGIKNLIEIMQEGRDHLGFYLLEAASRQSLIEKIPGKSPIFTKDDGKSVCTRTIGFNHRMTFNRCKVCAWDHGSDSMRTQDFSVIFPLAELKAALKTLQKIFHEFPVELPLNGIMFRFLKESDGFLMYNGNTDAVAIEWTLAPRLDRFGKPMMGLPMSQAVTQALIQKHKGRPHWAKNGLHYISDHKLLHNMYEHFPNFLQVMKEFDPHGIFLNDFGRRLIYSNYFRTAHDPYIKYCALSDNCVCQNDNDCGKRERNSYICGELAGYPVCRERKSFTINWRNRREKAHEFFRGGIVKQFIQLVKNRFRQLKTVSNV